MLCVQNQGSTLGFLEHLQKLSINQHSTMFLYLIHLVGECELVFSIHVVVILVREGLV